MEFLAHVGGAPSLRTRVLVIGQSPSPRYDVGLVKRQWPEARANADGTDAGDPRLHDGATTRDVMRGQASGGAGGLW